MPENLRAASVQFQHAAGEKEVNLAKIARFVSKAAKQQVQLAVFPEMCITGYWHVRHLDRRRITALAEPVPQGSSTQNLLSLARQYQISIGAGLIELGEDGGLYNSYVVAMPNGSHTCHRKLHCFISEHMSSGNSTTVFDLPQGWKAGILICYDNNIIENARLTALAGAEVLLAPHQTGGCHSRSPHGMKPLDADLWRNRKNNPQELIAACRGPNGRQWLMRWLPSRAHDNGMFLIFSNGIGLDDDEVRTGNAMILDPYGEIIAETALAEEDMIVADLDPQLRKMCTGQRWMAARRPELYGKLTESTGREVGAREARFSEEL